MPSRHDSGMAATGGVVIDDYQAQISKGAAALVKGGVVCDPVTGDVLHDHDWTPMEAAEVVLDAVNYRGAVDDLAEAVRLLDNARCDLHDLALKGAWGRKRKALRMKWGR
jgi:hypothetical protein